MSELRKNQKRHNKNQMKLLKKKETINQRPSTEWNKMRMDYILDNLIINVL